MKEVLSPKPLVAIGYMLGASALLAGTNLLAKMLGGSTLGGPLHPLQISHGRFLFAFLALGFVVALLRPQFTRPHLALHVARTTCGWAGVSLMFAAVTFIPLPDATAISFLNPVIAMMLAIPLLGERVGPVRWFAAAIAIIGGVVLLRPSSDEFQPAVLLAFAAAAVTGLEVILIKLLSGRERPLQILFTNNTIGLLIATAAVGFVWISPAIEQWLALMCLGLTMASAQFCFIQAMRWSEASFVVTFSYTALVFATVYDYAVFEVVPDVVSIIGAGIILSGAVLLAWREAHLKAMER